MGPQTRHRKRKPLPAVGPRVGAPQKKLTILGRPKKSQLNRRALHPARRSSQERVNRRPEMSGHSGSRVPLFPAQKTDPPLGESGAHQGTPAYHRHRPYPGRPRLTIAALRTSATNDAVLSAPRTGTTTLFAPKHTGAPAEDVRT